MTTPHPYRHLHAYVHEGRIGVLVEIGCATDFLARTDEFKALARDIALQIAAMAPTDIGMLLEQPFVKDESRIVSDVVRHAAERFGEHIGITRFIRWSTSETAHPEEDPPPRMPAVVLPFRRPD